MPYHKVQFIAYDKMLLWHRLVLCWCSSVGGQVVSDICFRPRSSGFDSRSQHTFFLENQVILTFLLYLKKSGGKKCFLDMLRKQAQQQGLGENAHLHQSS